MTTALQAVIGWAMTRPRTADSATAPLPAHGRAQAERPLYELLRT